MASFCLMPHEEMAVRTPVRTHLPADEVPLEWAVSADGILYTALIPIRGDGSFETGSIERQAALTFDNLRRVVTAAGGTMANVTQVLIYLTDPAAFEGMNEVYRQFFDPPYPKRGDPGRGRADGARDRDRDRCLRPSQTQLTAVPRDYPAMGSHSSLYHWTKRSTPSSIVVLGVKPVAWVRFWMSA